jgi:hypothetical protein
MRGLGNQVVCLFGSDETCHNLSINLVTFLFDFFGMIGLDFTLN